MGNALKLAGVGLGAIAALLFLRGRNDPATTSIPVKGTEFLQNTTFSDIIPDISFDLEGFSQPAWITNDAPLFAAPEPFQQPDIFTVFKPPVQETLTVSITLDDLYTKHGNAYGVSPLLLKAIAMQESCEDIFAIHGDGQSRGLMGILCQTNSTDPNTTEKCRNTLHVDGWEGASPANLNDPDFNIKIAAQILAWNIKNYGNLQGIAIYNNWGARLDPQGGPFRNQNYVDSVLAHLNRLGGSNLQSAFT